MNNSREEELAVGMKEVSAQATTITTKTAKAKTMTKNNIMIICIIMTTFDNNHNNDNKKYNSLLDNDIDYLSKTATTTMATKNITIFWRMIRTVLQKPQQQQ